MRTHKCSFDILHNRRNTCHVCITYGFNFVNVRKLLNSRIKQSIKGVEQSHYFLFAIELLVTVPSKHKMKTNHWGRLRRDVGEPDNIREKYRYTFEAFSYDLGK